MKKYFAYYDSAIKGKLHLGPYYEGHSSAVNGRRYYHSQEDMLKMGFSPTINKKIESAGIGTHIKLHRLHSRGDFMVKCISESEAVEIDDVIELSAACAEKQRQLQEQLQQYQKICNKILQ